MVSGDAMSMPQPRGRQAIGRAVWVPVRIVLDIVIVYVDMAVRLPIAIVALSEALVAIMLIEDDEVDILPRYEDLEKIGMYVC
jgi:hypothetical protein